MHATDSLRREQELVLMALDVCEMLATRIREGRPVEHAPVVRLLDLLQNYMHRRHHSKVVEVLLPWLERRSGVQEGMLTPWTRREHLSAQGHLLAAVEASHGLPASRSRFLRQLNTYVALTRWHLGMMQNVLLPIADSLGAPAEDAELLRALGEVAPDSELEETRVQRVLEALAEDLEFDLAGRLHAA